MKLYATYRSNLGGALAYADAQVFCFWFCFLRFSIFVLIFFGLIDCSALLRQSFSNFSRLTHLTIFFVYFSHIVNHQTHKHQRDLDKGTTRRLRRLLLAPGARFCEVIMLNDYSSIHLIIFVTFSSLCLPFRFDSIRC